MNAWLRKRAAAARDGERGFALVFVLLVTTLVMAGVATSLAVTTPNITNAKTSQDTAAAELAAQSGIDDAIAYLSGIPSCRSETHICAQALGADSSQLNRPGLGTGQTYRWTTGSQVTSDDYVRVTSRGTSEGVTRTLVADLSLQPSILTFGYYTNYESQSPAYLYDYYGPRSVWLSNSNTYQYVNAYNTRGQTISVQKPTNVQWYGPPTSGNNPYPASVCGQHWYSDGSSSPGRYSTASGGISLWGETGTINSNNVIRTSSCDVVFTSGMTENGPIYTRDALYISDAGGNGPIFQQPVYSLWGYSGYRTPTPPANPWRTDPNSGGSISNQSPYKPQIANADLTLPKDIGEDGIPDNACIYYGPTRVQLNGNGTATVTSPATTSAVTGADPHCYPSGSLANGVIGYTLNYTTTGTGTIYVQNRNTPSNGWPENGTKSTQTPSASNEIFYIPSTSGGATQPDQTNSSTATSTCTSSATYNNTADWPCAWSNLYSATDTGPYSGYGWTSYTKTSCSSAQPTNRELFECEYQGQTGNTQLSVNQSGGAYSTLRKAIQADLAKGTCLTGTTTAQMNCIAALVNNDLAPADTSTHRYVVTAGVVNNTATGAARSVGSAANDPTNGDPMFTFTGTPAQESATETPIALLVSRETYSNGAWGNDVSQFTFTTTQNNWSISKPASGAAYFPNPNDVSEYDTGADSSGNAAGSTGSAQPGDLYVQGQNNGQLSLIAQNNVEITGDITDTGTTGSNSQAVDITAEGNVRNYHPVSCVDTTASDIAATSPGWCPNDITGLTRSSLVNSNGTFQSAHPAAQYTNMALNGTATTGTRTIDAAIFALDGSFLTDNYDRGQAIGALDVNGGIYQSHRGANGVQWSSGSTVARTGYNLDYSYVDLEHANLPYAPPVTSGANTRVWNVVSISSST